MFSRWIFAPGTTLPLGSVTTPAMDAEKVCANELATKAPNTKRMESKNTRLRLSFMKPPGELNEVSAWRTKLLQVLNRFKLFHTLRPAHTHCQVFLTDC